VAVAGAVWCAFVFQVDRNETEMMLPTDKWDDDVDGKRGRGKFPDTLSGE
jgi:hypothetical protein